MTVPSGDSPDGSLQPGGFAAWQAETESSAKTKMKVPLGAWNTAQSNMHGEFISAPLFGGEVARLDNRIDEILIGTERAIRYTYSESDVWPKHPAAYKVVVDVLSGATSGRRGTGSAGGVGGWSGGWVRAEFTGSALEDLPAAVAVTIGAGTAGGDDGAAGTTSFGTYVSTTGATTLNYGPGDRTYKMRGGTGMFNTTAGTDGSAGPFHPGGSAGRNTSSTSVGGNGFSISEGQVGVGSAGGGGGVYSSGGIGYAASRGGHGGWPAAPGGGGGGSNHLGSTVTEVGGNGAAGAVFVTVYVADDFGIPPSSPTGLAASSITKNSARVSWSASIDDVMVKHYILYLNGSRYGVVTTTFHDFVGLAASTNYSVRLQAVDIGDNVSELSDPLSFTTLAS